MENTIPVLEIKNVSKSFPGVKALQNVSLTAYKGECLALIGENGAGKSTLMKILSGAYSMDEGEIYIEGKKVNIHNPAEGQKAGVGVIYQELSLVRQFTAVENLFLGRWETAPGGVVKWKEMKKQVEDFYKSLGLQFNLNVPVGRLSVAQCQLIEITRAVFMNSKIIVMDEPTSSLTNTEVEILFDLMKRLQSQGITIIFISHKLEELFRACERVYVMKDGCNAGEFQLRDINKDTLVRAMVGRELKNYYPRKTNTPSDKVVLEVKDVDDGKMVHGVSFQVHAGEILGFSGLVGAGRTETMRAIFKAEPKAKGHVYIDGQEVSIKSPADAIRHGIAFATEDRRYEGLVLPLSVAHNISMANFDSICNKAGFINLRKERALAEKYKDNFNIRTPDVNKKVGELSGGNQQKVVVAKWMNTNVRVFIFDEPTRGIDVGAKAEIYQLMVDIAAQGNAVIMVSSELPEVLGVSDRILIMREGKITGELLAHEADEESIMSFAIGG